MQLTYDILRILSIGSFLYFGFSCLFSNGMVEEFERYGLSRFRRLVGALELLGAMGLLAGYFLTPLTVAAAAGLSLLMLLGVATRIRVRDSLLETLPAILLLAANFYILLYSLR